MQVDLGKEHSIEAVEMDYTLSSYDYPRGYELYVSDDASNWKRIASGKGKLEKTKIEFAKVNARYIKILQTYWRKLLVHTGAADFFKRIEMLGLGWLAAFLRELMRA